MEENGGGNIGVALGQLEVEHEYHVSVGGAFFENTNEIPLSPRLSSISVYEGR